MKTLFSQMVSIVGDLAGSSVDDDKQSSASFLERNQDDFFEKDREVIQNETLEGDQYIWILKGNGSGTSLDHSSEVCTEAKICSAHEKSKFYLISCSGMDSGEIEEISQEQALAIAKKNRGFFEHKPFRQYIVDVVSDYTGIDKLSIQEMSLFSETLNPTPDEKIFLKFEYNEKMNKVIIDMAKPHVKEGGINKKKHGVFLFSAQDRAITDRLKKDDVYLSIKPCNNASKVIAKEITKAEFESADKASKNKRKFSSELII